jgi:hypothetical protein
MLVAGVAVAVAVAEHVAVAASVVGVERASNLLKTEQTWVVVVAEDLLWAALNWRGVSLPRKWKQHCSSCFYVWRV